MAPNPICVGMRFAFLAVSALLLSAATPARADDPKKPLLLYVLGDQKIDMGDEYTEIENGKVLDGVRVRLTDGLAKTFGTPVLYHAFRSSNPANADIAAACAASGAAGTIAIHDAFGPGVNDTFRGAFTIEVRDCYGSEFFSETGSGVHGPGKEEIADVVMPAMEEAYAHIQKDVDDSPKASVNYVRYGVYMTSQEADSFWLPSIENGKTYVDECQPLGTASRAGLRVGDEVRSINGAPTVGIDYDALNAAMARALSAGTWTLEIAGKDKKPRTVTFQNQTVAWYVSHPIDPASVPPPEPLRHPEQTVPLTFPQ